MTSLPPLPPPPPRPQRVPGYSNAAEVPEKDINVGGYATMNAAPTETTENSSIESVGNNTDNIERTGIESIWNGGVKLFSLYMVTTTIIIAALWPYIVYIRDDSPMTANIALSIAWVIVLFVAIWVTYTQRKITVNWDADTVTIGKQGPRPISDIKYFYFKIVPKNNSVTIAVGFDKKETQKHLGGVVRPKANELAILEQLLTKSGLAEGEENVDIVAERKGKDTWPKQAAVKIIRLYAGKDQGTVI